MSGIAVLLMGHLHTQGGIARFGPGMLVLYVLMVDFPERAFWVSGDGFYGFYLFLER